MRRQKMNLSPTDFTFILVWWCFGLLFYSGGLLCIHAGGFPPYGLALPQGVMVFGQKKSLVVFSSQHFVVLNLGASRRDPLVPRESFENPHIIAHLFNVCRKFYYFFPVRSGRIFFPIFRFFRHFGATCILTNRWRCRLCLEKKRAKIQTPFFSFVDFF